MSVFVKYQGPDPIEVWGRTLISLSRHLDQAHRCSLLFSFSIVSLHHIFACYSSVVHPGSSSLYEICDFFFLSEQHFSVICVQK